ncbi:MAG: PEP-CTERM sorting domain-containing protein [Phycisphaerales bacterium]|nr:PEP-CTERM sorting domain-containing protein [Phycisphaerales bacterium]
MSNRQFFLGCVAAAFASVVLTSTATAGVWGGVAGSYPNQGQHSKWAWSGGKNSSVEHFHGDPVISEDGVLFNATQNFRAEKDGNLSVTDTAELAINTFAVAAPPLQEFRMVEWGTWHIPEGSGMTPQDLFTIQADLFVLRLTDSNISSLDISPTIVFNPDGTWYNEGTLQAPAGGWPLALFKMTNTLFVDGSAPSGTFFQKGGMGMLGAVPEPTTLLLLVAGSSALLLRRRNSRR